MDEDEDSPLTHLDARGQARMVDVGEKAITKRVAIARGRIVMQPATLALITSRHASKGDVLATARIAGIQAAKRTHELIPLCHAIALTSVEVDLLPDEAHHVIDIEARVHAQDRTGAEMEALTAVTVAALTVYDMLKAKDRAMLIEGIAVHHKSGGKSGDFNR